MELSGQTYTICSLPTEPSCWPRRSFRKRQKKKKTQQTFIYFLEVEKVYDLIFKYTNKTFSTKFLSPYL